MLQDWLLVPYYIFFHDQHLRALIIVSSFHNGRSPNDCIPVNKYVFQTWIKTVSVKSNLHVIHTGGN